MFLPATTENGLETINFVDLAGKPVSVMQQKLAWPGQEPMQFLRVGGMLINKEQVKFIAERMLQWVETNSLYTGWN